MKATKSDLDAIHDILKPLLGHVAWNVKIGIGSFITMEFGDPIPSSHDKKYGEWYLWIYYCGWYLEKPNATFIGSEDPREFIKKELTILEGHSLEDILISSFVFETNFVFDNGYILHTFPLNFINPSEYWKLYTPLGKVLIIGPEGKWSYNKSTEKRR